MESVSRRNPVTGLGAAAILVSTLLLSGGGCTQAMQGTGSRVSNGGLNGPPSDNAATTAYIKYGIHFDDNANGHVDAKLKGQTRTVRIEPETTSDTVNWHAALTDNLTTGGKFVARISKVDGLVPELGLDENHKYSYMWVGPISNDNRRRAVAFYTVNSNGVIDSGPRRPIYVITRCNDMTGPRPSARLNPKHDGAICDDSKGIGAPPDATYAAVQLASSTPKLSHAVQAGGLWISCSGGCCDVGAFY